MIYPWQQTQWQSVLQQFAQARLPHALLLTGPEGLGQVDFAHALAARLLCDNAGEHACGQCRSCELLAAGSHPDFYTLTLEEKSQVIKVDQIRALVGALNQTAQRDNHQVAIIHPAEAMHVAAANALLKTLEEPTNGVHFILVSYQYGRLPATIISRTQRLSFSVQDEAATLSWLADKIPEQYDAKQMLRLAEYAPLHALELIKQDYLAIRDSVLKSVLNIAEAQANPVVIVEEYMKRNLALIMQALLTLSLDMVRLKLNVEPSYLFHQDRVDVLAKLASKVALLSLQQFADRLQQSQQLLNSTANANMQLVFEKLLIDWQTLYEESNVR